MFEQQLQILAEQLADALGRSVIIDDAALRPVAVSAQTGLVDTSRVRTKAQKTANDDWAPVTVVTSRPSVPARTRRDYRNARGPARNKRG